MISGWQRSFAFTALLCFSVAVIEGYDLQVMSGIGPLLRAAPLHIDHQQLGVLFGATVIGLGIGATLGGYIADRIGRKSVVVLSAFAMCLFTFATVFAFSFPSLLLCRLLTGLAIGGAMPNTIVMVSSAAEGRRGGGTGAVTLMMCGIPAGGIAAALASHGLADAVGWKGVLMFGAAFALCVAVAVQLGLTDQRPASSKRRADHQAVSGVLFGEGRAAMTLVLWTLCTLSLAIVALLAGWLPTLVVDKGLPASAGFSTLLAWNVGGVIGVVMMGRLCDFIGARNALIVAYLGMGALFVMFAKGSAASTFMLFAALVNFFVAGSHYTVYGLSPRLYPAEGAGVGVGAALASGRVGSVFGPVIAGMALSTGSTGDQVILSLVPVAVICALCVVGLVVTSRGKLSGPAGESAIATTDR